MKFAIVGAGAVGQTCLLATVLRGAATEIVVVNRTRERAEGLVTDIRYGAVLSPAITLRAGDYPDIAGAGLVMVTSGINEKEGGATDRADPEGRLKLLAKNAVIYRDIIPRIAKAAPGAIVLVVADPPDALADIARPLAPGACVLSTGTFLDSLRFRVHLAAKLDANPRAIEALVLGEHGTSSVFLWSSARVGGLPILDALGGRKPDDMRREVETEVRQANITIIEGTGASQLGIGMVCARIAEAVARDERAVLPIGVFHPDYGVTLSLPSVLGRAGIVRVFKPEMTGQEQADMHASAEHIRAALQKAGA
jgi:L-lactate dehydrogenase